MSDFIKVKHEDDTESVTLNKEDIVLTEMIRKDVSIFKYVNRRELSAETPLWYDITREEYDRLCRELYVDSPGDEARIKDLEYSNKCLRYERDEAQRKYLELIHQQKCRDAERARKELGVE